MHTLTLLHRWLGVAFCLLFALWFASGLVMHFVPFPALTETERVAGLAAVDPTRVLRGPADAVTASGMHDVRRVRMIARPGGPVYLVKGTDGTVAVRAGDLSPANVQAESTALMIALDHARRRGMDVAAAKVAELASHDQWTVPNSFDPHRPLYRIALNDEPGTELYVSSATGEVVLDTTRRERAWNYAGSVAHWIYPTALRRHARVWNPLVWTISLGALIAAISGAVLGVLRVGLAQGRVRSPFQGWQAWHHWLGIGCMTFVLTWTFSGWLSMDDGLLFPRNHAPVQKSLHAAGAAAWEKLTAPEIRLLHAQAREVEWFAFDGRLYRRERLSAAEQHLNVAGAVAIQAREYLQSREADAAMLKFAPDCTPATAVLPNDDYPVASSVPRAPVFRAICGDTWFQIDGASGAMLETLDATRRAYRWSYAALHTLDFPALVARPVLRTNLIAVLCGCGLAFSLTAVVIGWRRLRRGLRPLNAG